MEIVTSYNRQKKMNKLGIKISAKDVSLLLLDAYSIIEDEMSKLENIEMEKQWKK